MEDLHTPTIQIATTIVSFSSTIVMLLMWRSKTGVQGLGCWTGTIALFGAGFLLLSQVGRISEWFSLVLSGAMITGGFALYYRGACYFSGTRSLPALELASVSIVAISMAVFTFVEPHLGIRALVQASVVGFISIAIALVFWRQRRAPWRLAAFSVAGVFAFTAILMLFRIVVIATDIDAYSFATNQTVPLLNLFFMSVQVALTLSTLFLASAYLTSQLRLKAEQLEQSNIALTEFAYIASHDLKEPLRTITSYSELLQQSKENKLDELGKMSLSFIHEAALRMHELIEGLLQHSHIGQDFKTSNIETGPLITLVLKDLTVMLEESRGSVTAADLPVVNANETELRLLFQNLITNALKFRDPEKDPEVSIRATSDSTYWKFSITDNGIGIDPAQHHKLFKIFSRLNDRSEYDGTGIGLAHCRKIVERHGGSIWLDSALNYGSTFFFTLPAHRPSS